MSRPAFEHSPLLQAATELAIEVYAIADTSPFDGRKSLQNQIKSAAMSVSETIAEGLERGTKDELRAFLFVARSSAGEVRSLLRSLEDDPEFAGLRPEIFSLRSKAEAITKLLGTWGRCLRNSAVEIREAPNAKARQASLAARRTREFLYELDQMRSAQGETQSAEYSTQDEAPEAAPSAPDKGTGPAGIRA